MTPRPDVGRRSSSDMGMAQHRLARRLGVPAEPEARCDDGHGREEIVFVWDET
jgi:hypothetical protein